ncbi:BA75_03732T0 [Komagataella pastoris]|uniref:BA75_03732T0 n=1 Tax=Komagataella pastoris TaxID=4922 RepID=A0A1B2JF84_PICPA|nr:BA75_03732T0 [Komagataella pastoris]
MGICASKEQDGSHNKRGSADTQSTKNSLTIKGAASSRGGSGSSPGNAVTKSSKPKVNKTAKMLLLGSGESGKSTILKQIKIIHQNGFTNDELIKYKKVVFQNILDVCQELIKGIRQFELENELTNLTTDELSFINDYVLSISDDHESFNQELAEKITKLFHEPATLKLLSELRHKFYLMDSAQYFIDNSPRIMAPDYFPSVSDILRMRQQTSGILEINFQLEDLNINLYDVGGQRSERKKWIHCFDNVNLIVFCVSLSEYDQTLSENDEQNRLTESLVLFDSVVNSRWFTRSSILLCLNKIDILIDKLPASPLENFFPDYTGGNDVGKAVKYILWRFKQLNRSNLPISASLTNATDTSNIEETLNREVKASLLDNMVTDIGIS